MPDRQTIEGKIDARIRRKGDRWVFSQHDFSELGTRSAVDLALHRMSERGEIRRAIRGLYYRPRTSKLLGADLGPDIHAVAEALARKFGWSIQPGGAAAENYLGLSTQVPAKSVYFSSGPSRVYAVGRTSLTFRHTAPKEAAFKHPESAVIVRALRSRGREHVTARDIEKIRGWLPGKLRAKVLADTRTATDWVHEKVKQICRGRDDG